MVQGVVKDMNNIIKQAENSDKIVKIQTSFSNSFILLEPGRIFIREGTVSLLSSKKKILSLFLFNDLLLLAKKSSGNNPNYVLEDRVVLSQCTISEPDAQGMSLDITSTNNRWTVIFKSVNEKNSWSTDINKQIKALLEKEGQVVNAINMTKRAKAIITKESAVRLTYDGPKRKSSF